MPHVQQQVIDLVASILASGSTAAGTRVFTDRVDPLQPHEMPAILVVEGAGGEQIEPLNISGGSRRTLDVQVLCIVAGGSASASQARALGLQVEKLIHGSTALRSLCRLGIAMISSRPQISGDGDRIMAARDQAWTFTTATLDASPETPL